MPAPRVLDPLSSLAAFFGSEIRRMREQQGWSQEELAGKLGWSLATVASVETARRSPPHGFPEKADAVFGLPEMLEHLAELVRSTPRWFEHYIELEAQATRINIWSMNLVPGLFQTEDYARTVMRSGWPLNPPDSLEEELAERLERQRILERPSPPNIWVVLHEAAVKQPIKSVEVTRAQLKRLVELGRQPNVTLQILPFASGEHAGLGGPFTLFEFADQPPAAYAEGRGGSGRLLDQKHELETASLAYDQLRAAALTPEASIGLIVGAMSDIWIDRT
ncbi:helix-turn-helix domain-containing protein [Actinomadura sp. HBU206391]|uniref:helix-turn-helix domain-containing protein n=1 Tax=Actinomadura sp. HBU206391 TaxID=2731692 RepID=UPI00164FD1B1|nr:helix-turn-helix transcriptional regulator [Actinomadura sp. HBU206391]MBC6459826.1 helix-turn-helix transcriptional regulator [Actinomadura sp. HBU206391]